MFDSATYQRRRQALRNKVQNGIILILGNNEAPANYPDNTYKFRQDSSFLYFFGHSHPGYAGVIDIEAGEDYFFGNDVDMDDIIWMGPQPSVKELAAQVGIQKSFPFPQLKEVVKKRIMSQQEVIQHLCKENEAAVIAFSEELQRFLTVQPAHETSRSAITPGAPVVAKA